jgi:hypothetical protein
MKKSLLVLALLMCSSVYANYTVVFGKNDNINFTNIEVTEPEIPEEPEVPEEPAEPVKDNSSCKSLLDGDATLSNGVYPIKSGGSEIAMYCDMSGGGWTLVGTGIRGQTAGWATSGDLNLTPSPSTSVGFKLSDSRINSLPKSVYRVVTGGRYANYRFFSGSCNYKHNATATGACNVSYGNDQLSVGMKQGVPYGEVGGLSDFNQAAGTLYVITGYIGSIAQHGWGMGNGVTNGYSGTAIAGDGGGIQIWVK